MRIYPLNNYFILSLKPNAEKSLSGLTTNTTSAKQNACIDKFGRIVATFWQQKLNDNEIIIILDKRASGPLLEHLKQHLALTNTKIERKKDLFAYYDLEKKEVLLSQTKMESNVSEEEFIEFRLRNNIPLQYIDYNNEMILNVSYDFVSFTKGCYLGQEVIARVHHLGKAPKKLVADLEKKRFVFVENR
ncbi:tRNA-modifying protein YgfZ [Candidatus Woesearchaeota archaeon]|nr:tRNA-modifying protein YgfZ [Candidatus Woesearchaeota archaeon]